MQIRNFCLGFAVFFLLGIGIVSAQEPETLVELGSFDRTFIDPPDIFGTEVYVVDWDQRTDPTPLVVSTPLPVICSANIVLDNQCVY